MTALTFIFRLLGLALVAASFFMGKVMLFLPGLPLQIGSLPFKHVVFGVGVVLYFIGAWISRREWDKTRRSKGDEL